MKSACIMKHKSVIQFLLILLFAIRLVAQNPHTDENLTLATNFYTSLCNDDKTYAMQLMDTKVNCDENCHGSQTGKFSVLENILKSLNANTTRPKLSNLEYRTMSDDQILVTGNYRTENGVSLTFAHWWWIKDEKLVRLRHYTDSPAIQN